MSYSQNAEEAAIIEAVGDDQIGIFLDIGAYDGEAKSNTLALVERGWSGVLVEPSLHAFTRLLKLHGGKSHLHLVHALIGINSGLSPFWNSTGDAVSTTLKSHFENWSKQTGFDPPYYMPQISIEQLIAYFPFLRIASVVNIDTEGSSADLFMRCPLRPKVFCVEKDGRREELLVKAENTGYKLTYESGEKHGVRKMISIPLSQGKIATIDDAGLRENIRPQLVCLAPPFQRRVLRQDSISAIVTVMFLVRLYASLDFRIDRKEALRRSRRRRWTQQSTIKPTQINAIPQNLANSILRGKRGFINAIT